MSSGRRRSARLIESPWVFNWPKKAPIYINLDSDSGGLVEKQRNLDMRSERGLGKMSNALEFSDDDDDFVTPAEHFGKSKPASVQIDEKKKMSDNAADMLAEESKKNTKKRNRGTEDMKVSNMDAHLVEGSRRRTINKAVNGISTARPAGRQVAKPMQEGKHDNAGNEPKKSKGRSHEGYLQKKFTPAIISDLFVKLSEQQVQWVKKTGFGELLNFESSRYPHKLGYNLAQAFDVGNCALVLKCGTIEINDKEVNNVLGLPMGNLVLTTDRTETNSTVWAGQFEEKAGCEISPTMLRDSMVLSKDADVIFKLNFLVMIYNFFIEGHQNRYLNRDVLKLELDLDACGRYNWCRLLIDKLRTSHTYWAAEKEKRIFTGSLTFLTYLYVSRIRNEKYAYVPQVFPAFKGWTDTLIRERQKNEATDGSFGLGEIVAFVEDNEKDAVLVNNLRDKMMNPDDQFIKDNAQLKSNSDDDKSATNELDDIEGHNDLETEKNLVSDLVKNVGDQILHIIQSVNDNNEESVDGGADHMFQEIGNINTNLNPASCAKHTVAEMGLGASFETNGTSGIVKSGDGVQKAKVQHNLTTSSEGINKDTPVFETVKSPGSMKKDPLLQGPQGTDEEDAIDNHFREDIYIKEFRKNLVEFGNSYEKCVNNLEVALALYPSNEELAELKEEHKRFFKFFEENSPLSKKLLAGKIIEKNKSVEGVVDDGSYVPSFSLGITQVTPRNLGDMMDEKDNAGGEIDEGGNQLVMRPRRGARMTEICRSPFVSRVVDISGHKLTNEEKYVWEWLFENRRNRSENLFEWETRMCTKAHLQSLQVNCMVDSSVIDAWSYVLNANEALRANTSPYRVFMTTETTSGPMNMVEDLSDPEWTTRRHAVFHENMDVVMETITLLNNRLYDVQAFDLFVFPIYNASHHYIISYNMRKPAWDIIDNRVPDGDIEQVYGDLPYQLHDCFCDWIAIFDVPKVSEIVKLSPRVVRLGWQTRDSSIDCGIFTMRHMETYMGNLFRWNSGLRTETENQKSLLNKLRVVYGHKILTWDLNNKKESLMRAATYLAKGKKIAT